MGSDVFFIASHRLSRPASHREAAAEAKISVVVSTSFVAKSPERWDVKWSSENGFVIETFH